MMILTAIFLCLTVFLLPASGDGNSLPQMTTSLTSYLDQYGPKVARMKSLVDKDYLDNFDLVSYAGLITVNKKAKRDLFFWYIPSDTDPNAPLLLWLNGGPATSSMMGLLHLNGPVKINPRLKNGSVTYSPNEHSWVGPFSMLYVDNPASTGYSSVPRQDQNTTANEDVYIPDLYNFLQQFFRIYPKQKKVDFYLGGQSYAGMYITSLAHYIHTQNKRVDTTPIPFNGIYLGGPLFESSTQFEVHPESLYHTGAITYQRLLEHKQKIRDIFAKNAKEQETSNLLDVLLQILSHGFGDNFVTQKFAPLSDIQDLMNSEKMKLALHMGNSSKFVVDNHLVYLNFLQDFLKSRKELLADLLDNDYKALIYNGDLDMIVTTPMIDAVLRSMSWKHQERYNSSSTRKAWRQDSSKVVSSSTDNPGVPKGRVKGYYSKTGSLCRVVITGAGHQTPHDQPESCLDMMKHFVQDGCIPDKSKDKDDKKVPEF